MRSYAHASLTETLDVMNARIVKEACIGLQVDADQLCRLGIALNPDLSRPIASALATFAMRFVCYLAAPRFRPWEPSIPNGPCGRSFDDETPAVSAPRNGGHSEALGVQAQPVSRAAERLGS